MQQQRRELVSASYFLNSHGGLRFPAARFSEFSSTLRRAYHFQPVFPHKLRMLSVGQPPRCSVMMFSANLTAMS